MEDKMQVRLELTKAFIASANPAMLVKPRHLEAIQERVVDMEEFVLSCSAKSTAKKAGSTSKQVTEAEKTSGSPSPLD